MSVEKPLVGVVSDRRQIDSAHYFHMIGEKYLQALVDAAGVYPVGLDLLEILGRLDGLFLTGNPSNVEPERYKGHPSKSGTLHDPERDATVNSLHSQAVDRLADGLSVEATADDGLIEGFVVRDAPGFALGVQWHPEWQVHADEVSTSIFRAFGEACRK